MESKDEAERGSRKPRVQSIILLLILAISIVLTGWALLNVSISSQIPSLDFVALPTVPLSTTGEKVMFASISAVAQKGLAVGVKGYLMTASGAPVAEAQVYMRYYLQGSYRTQAATTDQSGYFEAHLPMNWTGWLEVTFTYFGDDLHQGLTQVFSLSEENL